MTEAEELTMTADTTGMTDAPEAGDQAAQGSMAAQAAQPAQADLTETTDLREAAVRAVPAGADEPTTELPHLFDEHVPPPVDPAARPARHRERSLLTDTQRAMFLQQWDAIQTGFVTGPDRTADAAEHLVNDVARRIVQNIGTVRDQALRPVDEAVLAQTTSDPAEVGTEKQRARLLQCREAFSLLIDC